MSPLKHTIITVAVLIMATGQAARAAQVDTHTQELLGLQPLVAPDTSWLRQSPPTARRNKSVSQALTLQPRAVSSNGVIYSVTDYFDTQSVVPCINPDGSAFGPAYATRSLRGITSLIVEGNTAPLISDDTLPGGQTITSLDGCSRDAAGVVYVFFLTADPNNRLSNGQPFLSLWYADSNRHSVMLASVGKTFTAKDPRTNLDATYTIQQVSGASVRKGKVTTLLVAAPPQVSASVPPVPQGLFVKIGTDGQITVLFNNLKDANNNFWFSSLSNFVMTDTSLYIAGQLTETPPTPVPPATKSNQVLLSRIGPDGKPVTIKGYFNGAGSVINSLSNGVQITSLDSTNSVIQYSFLPDNSLPVGSAFQTGEVTIYAGTNIDGVTLSPQDLQIPVSQNELYIVSSTTGSLLNAKNGTAKLVHTPQMSPGGNARDIAVAGNLTAYVQNQNGLNFTYYMYMPTLSQAFYTGSPGDTVTIEGTGLVVDGALPSISLNIGGRNVAFGADSTGKITVTIPSFAQPGTYNGTINASGVVVPLTVVVQPAGQPAAVIASVQNAANFQVSGALVPEELVTIFLSKPVGTTASAQTFPTYELGNVSATFEGVRMPIIYNGNGQINALLPKAAGGKTQGKIIVSVKYGSTAVNSVPVSINIGVADDSFFEYNDTDGKRLAIVTDANFKLIGAGNPATPGQTVSGFGTGCMPDPTKLPDDDKIVPAYVPSAVFPTLVVGGKTATVLAAGLAPGFAGLCQYNFVIPAGVSGDVSMQFAGTAYTYTFRVK